MNHSGSMLENELISRLQNLRQTGENTSESTVFFDKDYDGFNGHFENNPVVPGVCIFQWIRIHLQELLQCKLTLTAIDQCRFRKPLLANAEGLCRIKINSRDAGQLAVQADILSENEIACRVKAKGSFQ